MSMIQLNLRLTEGGSFATSATVVRLFEGAFAVSIDASPQEILSSLTARPDAKEESEGRRDSTVWDRIPAMPYAENITGLPIRRYTQQLSISPARPRRSR